MSSPTPEFSTDGTFAPNYAVKSVVLSSAQILDLHDTPIALVPAPGAGKYVEVLEIVGKSIVGETAYTGSNALEFRYTDGSGTKVTGDLASTFINVASGTQVAKAIGAAAVLTANAPVVAVVPVANPAAGDGVITLYVSYRIIS